MKKPPRDPSKIRPNFMVSRYTPKDDPNAVTVKKIKQKRGNVMAEIREKALEKYELTQERIAKELARLAFLDPRQMLNVDGTVKAMHEMDDDTAAAIASMVVLEEKDSKGKVTSRVKKIKFWDKNSALEKAAKSIGMLTDKVNLTGNLNINEMSDEELDAKIASLTAEAGAFKATGGAGPPKEDEQD